MKTIRKLLIIIIGLVIFTPNIFLDAKIIAEEEQIKLTFYNNELIENNIISLEEQSTLTLDLILDYKNSLLSTFQLNLSEYNYKDFVKIKTTDITESTIVYDYVSTGFEKVPAGTVYTKEYYYTPKYQLEVLYNDVVIFDKDGLKDGYVFSELDITNGIVPYKLRITAFQSIPSTIDISYRVKSSRVKSSELNSDYYTTNNYTETLDLFVVSDINKEVSIDNLKSNLIYSLYSSGTSTSYLSVSDPLNKIMLNRSELDSFVFSLMYDYDYYLYGYINPIIDLKSKDLELFDITYTNNKYYINTYDLGYGKLEVSFKINSSYSVFNPNTQEEELISKIINVGIIDLDVYIYDLNDFNISINDISMKQATYSLYQYDVFNIGVEVPNYLNDVKDYFKYQLVVNGTSQFDNTITKYPINYSDVINSTEFLIPLSYYSLYEINNNDLGDYNISLTIHDTLLTNCTGIYPNYEGAGITTKNVIVSRVDDATYYERPTFNITETPYVFDCSTTNTLNLILTNYESVKNKAEIIVLVDDTKCNYSIKNDSISINFLTNGMVNIKVKYQYFDYAVENTFEVLVVNGYYQHTFDKLNLNINLGSSDTIRLGAIDGDNFIPLSTSAVGSVFNIFCNSDIISIDSNISDLVTQPGVINVTGLSKGSTNFSIVETSHWEIINVYSVVVNVIDEYTPHIINFDFVEGNNITTSINNVVTLTIPSIIYNRDTSFKWDCINSKGISIDSSSLNYSNITISEVGVYTINVIGTNSLGDSYIAKCQITCNPENEAYPFLFNEGDSLHVDLSKSKTFTVSVPNLVKSFGKDYQWQYDSIFKEVDNDSKSITLEAISEGRGTITCTVTNPHGDTFTASIFVNVDNTDAYNKKTCNFEFLEGKSITLISKINEEKTITLPDNLKTLQSGYTWYSFDNSVCSIINNNDTSVVIKAISEGSTYINCIFTNQLGDTYIGSIIVNVITDNPNFTIDFEKASGVDETISITKYDEINVSLNTHGFTLNNPEIKWYIDDTLNSYTSYSFKVSNLEKGDHTFKAVIKDSRFTSDIVITQELNVTDVVNKVRELSFKKEEINLLLEGSEYLLEVLLDGVVIKNQDYIWEYDSNYLSVLDANEVLQIKPLKEGNTKVLVKTNIAKYGAEHYIEAVIDVFIESLSEITIKETSLFNKPNEPMRLLLLHNNKVMDNALENTKVLVSKGSEAYTNFVVVDGEILFDAPIKGNYNITVGFNNSDITNSLKVEVSNLSLKQIIKICLPYLAVICLILIIISTIMKHRKSDFERVRDSINKLNKELNDTIANLNDTTYQKQLKKLFRQFRKNNYKVTYLVDKGIDQLKSVALHIDISTKAIKAGLLSDVVKSKQQVKQLLVSINTKNMQNANDIFNEVAASFKAYKENSIKMISQIDKEVKQTPKKMTSEEYLEYLKNLNYIDEEIDIEE